MDADSLTLALRACSIVATYLAHSTILLAGVWLFVRLRPNTSHAARETLWKLALIGGVVTTPAQVLFAPAGSWGAWQVELPGITHPGGRQGTLLPAGTAERTTSDRTTGLFGEGIAVGDTDVADTDVIFISLAEPVAVETPAAISGALTGQLDAAPATLTNSTSLWLIESYSWRLTSLAAGFALLIAIGLMRCLWQTVLLRRRLRNCRELVAGPARELLDELERFVPGSPRVRLLASPDCSEPAACGLFRWTIVLPERAERDLSLDELESLLAHELAHLARGDMWWLLASRAICSLGAFQPLNHLARREWQRAAEYLCDAWAVGRTGSPLALARCLTEVAGWKLNTPECSAILAATGRRSGLVERIERLVRGVPAADQWRDSRIRSRLLMLGILVLGLIAICGPRVSISTGVAGNDAAAIDFSVTSDQNDSHPDVASRLSEANDFSAEVRNVLLPEQMAVEPANPIDTLQELASLQRELAELDRELAEVRALLHRADVPIEARRLAKSLERQATEYRKRRTTLLRGGVVNGLGPPVSVTVPLPHAAETFE